MVAAFPRVFCIVLLLLCSVVSNVALFGKKKQEERQENEKFSSQESLALGLDALNKAATDPAALRETMAMLDDPETLKEVQALMKDPNFVAEMNKLKENPGFVKAMESAKELYSDPEKAIKVQAELSAAAQQLQMTGIRLVTTTCGSWKWLSPTSHYDMYYADAELGIMELAKSAKNPKMLAEGLYIFF